MYRKGHLGVSLLVFAPVGYALVDAGHPAVAAVAGLVMVQFATLPDVDHRLPMVEHRGATHSLAFAALVGAAGAAVGVAADAVVSVDLPLPAVGFAVGALTILAHLLGDTLTPMGVNYLWPLPVSPVSLSLTPADNPVVNSGLFGLGLAVTAGWVAFVAGLV
ncbi:metal-dependent hydrolase [Halohasta salina]|uniref:metal-dependent hydrolase n=1 Tax=Halohasta salina TaxID=2961621 RepID=UPI0020A23665|nr:metal-dependent hydrolase [Halohasta salina]